MSRIHPSFPPRLDCLLIGSGGREAALAWKLRQSTHLGRLFLLPGNPGLDALGERLEPALLADPEHLARWCLATGIGLVVIGPEQPLVEGLADHLRSSGLAVYGPSAAAARLEGSKAWAKAFMERHRIPTAEHRCFTRPDQALAFLETAPWPVVIKADGLAAGKGVVLPASPEEARICITGMLSGEDFGAAGREIVVERRLTGPELSLLAICDGTRAHLLAPAQDHKRVLDGDRGPNTGGMGTFAPSPHATPELLGRITDTILAPTLAGMAAEGHPFTGTLFIGLMLCADGPRVIEYNCRFGDPETQVVLPLLEEDLLELLWRVASGHGLEAQPTPVVWQGAAVCVVAASAGYPGPVGRSRPISGLEPPDTLRALGVECFTAGVARGGDGGLVSAGGRVYGLMARAATLALARERAYRGMELAGFEGMHFRRDIARAASGEDTR